MLTIVRDFYLWRVQACPITSEIFEYRRVSHPQNNHSERFGLRINRPLAQHNIKSIDFIYGKNQYNCACKRVQILAK